MLTGTLINVPLEQGIQTIEEGKKKVKELLDEWNDGKVYFAAYASKLIVTTNFVNNHLHTHGYLRKNVGLYFPGLTYDLLKDWTKLSKNPELQVR